MKQLLTIIFISSVLSLQAGLIDKMASLQYFTHKLGLAIDGNNQPLAKFYSHEIEELLAEIATIEDYHNIPIAQLSKAILVPSFKRLETAVDKNFKAAAIYYQAMINQCNDCHQKTNYSFINIEFKKQNPYLQSFTPEPDCLEKPRDDTFRFCFNSN